MSDVFDTRVKKISCKELIKLSFHSQFLYLVRINRNIVIWIGVILCYYRVCFNVNVIHHAMEYKVTL